MATCPSCGVSSREDPAAMEITEGLTAKPLLSFSLAGSTPKVSAHANLKLSCLRCGWSILGGIEGTDFVGDPETQYFPTQVSGDS